MENKPFLTKLSTEEYEEYREALLNNDYNKALTIIQNYIDNYQDIISVEENDEITNQYSILIIESNTLENSIPEDLLLRLDDEELEDEDIEYEEEFE
jgi:hypothetical protein